MVDSNKTKNDSEHASGSDISTIQVGEGTPSPEKSPPPAQQRSPHDGMLQPGDLLADRFEIERQLGRGGFGAVYAAMDRSLGRRIAIKQSRGLHSFVSGQVRNEARAIASLSHANIVQIHDLIEVSEEEYLIVMECLEGVPLSQRIRESRLEIDEAVRIGIDVAGALVQAHRKHLVHSDIKPGNLFVCHDGVVKLLDFG